MRTWYNFKAKSADVADLSIFDYIGYYGVEAAQFIADLRAITAPTINLSINSPGGDVFQAVAILNALRLSGKTINVRVLGIAASAAAYITLAGHTRTMPENTMQMLHNASSGAYTNAEGFRELADVLEKVDSALHATFITRTGLSAEKVTELLSKDTYLTAAECLELGLCDAVEPALVMTAAFEVGRLPAHVQALFKPSPFAETVAAMSASAGLDAEPFVLDASLTTVEAVTSALAVAIEVKALCEFAKVDFAPNARRPLADVRKSICEARATADALLHIDNTPDNPVHQPKTEVSTASIWAKRKKDKSCPR